MASVELNVSLPVKILVGRSWGSMIPYEQATFLHDLIALNK